MAKMIIVRGCPGSGKSTFAKKFGILHLEADMFHEKVNGGYCWTSENQKKAHQFCINMATQALVHGVDVAISNTFTQNWEFSKYLELAKTYGYEVLVYRCVNEYGNIHSVPAETLKKMKDRFEDYEGEVILK